MAADAGELIGQGVGEAPTAACRPLLEPAEIELDADHRHVAVMKGAAISGGLGHRRLPPCGARQCRVLVRWNLGCGPWVAFFEAPWVSVVAVAWFGGDKIALNRDANAESRQMRLD